MGEEELQALLDSICGCAVAWIEEDARHAMRDYAEKLKVERDEARRERDEARRERDAAVAGKLVSWATRHTGAVCKEFHNQLVEKLKGERDEAHSKGFVAGLKEALRGLKLVGLSDPAEMHTTRDNMDGRYEALGRCIRQVRELLEDGEGS